MASPPKTYKLPADSELARGLKESVRGGEPLLVDTGDAVYRLQTSPAEGSEPAESAAAKHRLPSPEEAIRSKEGILEAAGSWKHVDVEAFKAYVAERRRVPSRPPVRL